MELQFRLATYMTLNFAKKRSGNTRLHSYACVSAQDSCDQESGDVFPSIKTVSS